VVTTVAAAGAPGITSEVSRSRFREWRSGKAYRWFC
jgi:hypothetical protein